MSFLIDLMRFGTAARSARFGIFMVFIASQICPSLISSSFPHRCINPTSRSVSRSYSEYTHYYGR